MEEYNDIFEHIDSHSNQYIEGIRKYLHQPGISHTGEGVRESAELTLEYVEELGTENARLVETDGNPVVTGTLKSKNPNAKTIIAYTLYDEVPVVPEDWKFPPFSAEIVEADQIGAPPKLGKVICARAATNQRGPFKAFLCALKSIQAIRSDIPVNVIFALEGEEEIGCPHLHQFVQKAYDDLKKADAFYMPSLSQDEQGNVQVYRGARGTVKLELQVMGGKWGGSVSGKDIWSANMAWIDSPMWILIRALNTMVSETGKIIIDDFHENVRPFRDVDRDEIEKIKESFNEEMWKEKLDIRKFRDGLPGKELVKDYVIGPMLNVVGIKGGYTGPKVFTTLPMDVVAKVDIRFPPDMSSDEVIPKIRRHLDRRGFKMVQINEIGKYEWSRVEPTAAIHRATLKTVGMFKAPYTVWPTGPFVAPFGMLTRGLPGYPLDIPFSLTGLGHGAREHMANEYAAIEGLHLNMKYHVALLYEYAKMV